jgi:hypothetical protein
MGEEGNVWAMATVLCLVVACGGVGGVHVKLGEHGKAVIGGMAVLVCFDVLDGGTKW